MTRSMLVTQQFWLQLKHNSSSCKDLFLCGLQLRSVQSHPAAISALFTDHHGRLNYPNRVLILSQKCCFWWFWHVLVTFFLGRRTCIKKLKILNSISERFLLQIVMDQDKKTAVLKSSQVWRGNWNSRAKVSLLRSILIHPLADDFIHVCVCLMCLSWHLAKNPTAGRLQYLLQFFFHR